MNDQLSRALVSDPNYAGHYCPYCSEMIGTDAELKAEIAGEAPISDPDLVGYYSFDEADGLRAYDRSGNGNHMALGDGIAERAPSRVKSDRP